MKLIQILSLIIFVAPSIITNELPCLLCFTERSLFLIIFLLSFVNNQLFLLLNIATNFTCLLLAIYHSFIVLNLSNKPKFCEIQYNENGIIWQDCSKSSIHALGFIILINLLFLVLLYNRSKLKSVIRN